MAYQRRVFAYPFVCLLVLPVMTFSARADSSLDTLFNLPLTELVKLKVTSSTLTDKTLQTVPSSMTVFTHQQLKFLSVDYLHELMSFVPGFQVARPAVANDQYFYSARGRRTGDAPREILVLIDGQRVNREFDNSPASVYMASLDNIEKVEFIRGPGSAIYGSNAFAGVINITTRKDVNAVAVNSGTNHNNQVQVFSSAKLNDYSLDIYANGFRDEGESYRLEQTVTHEIYSSRDPRQGYDLNLKLGDDDSRLTIMHGQRLAEEFYNLEVISNPYNKERDEYTFMEFHQSVFSGKQLTTDFSFQYNESSVARRSAIIQPVINAEQKERGIDLNLQNNWFIEAGRSAQFGGSYRHVDNALMELKTIFGSRDLNSDGSRDVFGLYGQYQHLLAVDTELTLGARYDKYSQVGNALSPRFALTHQLSDIQTVKLLYGEAFRAPTFNETDLLAPSVTVGNPHLDPETIATWELVWMANWQDHSLAVTLFDSRIDDAIVQVQLNPTSRSHQNIDDPERSQGAELEYMVQLLPELQLRAQTSLFNTLPDSAFRQADKLASLIVSYQQGRWNLNVSANYIAQRDMLVGSEINTRTLASYWLLNSKFQYSFAEGYSIYLQGKNLSDDNYLTPPQGTGFSNGIPNRGRELSVGIEWMF